MSSTLPPDQRNEAESLRIMADFGQRARTLGMDCALYGLTSRALVLGAAGAGFRFLSGPAIQAEASDIAKALRFEPLDLYRDLGLKSPRGEAD